MEKMISTLETRKILEKGLKAGLWSIVQFNASSENVVLPSGEFIEENPQFVDPSFRDLTAYNNGAGAQLRFP